MRCFALLMRCATVASPTRNACAISAVVSPPTARSVRATADAGVNAGVAAHEEQDQAVVLVGDLAGRRSCNAMPRSAGLVAPPLVDQAPRRSLDEPAPRVLGYAVARPARGGFDERFCTASSAAAKSPYRRTSVPRTSGARSRSKVLGTRVQRLPPAVCRLLHLGDVTGRLLHHLPKLIGCCVGTPPGPGTAESFAAISIARLRLDVDDLEARQPLLEL